MPDFSDCTRTGISIFASAADYSRAPVFGPKEQLKEKEEEMNLAQLSRPTGDIQTVRQAK